MEAAVWLESVRIAMREMRRHPTRSTLTMLGVIFGVAALIAVVSISQGANQQIQVYAPDPSFGTFEAVCGAVIVLTNFARSQPEHSRFVRARTPRSASGRQI